MKTVIPYEKEIKFKTKIAEITSISLEHQDSINDTSINGEFILSGDYKAHQISVNKESFNYNIPFTIALDNNLDRNTIKYDITDFTYDIKDNDILVLKIEMTLEADVIEEELPREEVQEAIPEVKEEKEEVKDVEEEEEREENKEQVTEEKEDNKDNYVTYNIHQVCDGETVESIAKSYKISSELILEYNEVKEIETGMKLLIPEVIDE